MKTEDIVTSKEWSKKLTTAGWPQDESHFYWFIDDDGDMGESFWTVGSEEGYSIEVGDDIAAPTASEIIRRIPVADRIAVPTDRLDDPDSWAEIYCALQPTDLR